MKILIAEDSTSMAEMIEFTLKNEGHDCLITSNGREAIGAFVLDDYDLVITDLNMPKCNGIELTKWIRGNKINKFVPIIFLTTESQIDKKNEAKRAGATGWIVKPFKPEQLIKIVNKLKS